MKRVTELPTGCVRQILTDENPLLREVSASVDADDPAIGQDIADLAATLADFRATAGFGRAISAPQVGIMKRLVVMDLGAGAIALINPEIVARSDLTQMVWDDCLSVPATEVLVERSAQISIRYLDASHHRVEWHDLPPDLSELLEHECDHLDGVLMTDRAVPGESVRSSSA